MDHALARFARRLLGVTVTGLWRLRAVSADGAIPLPGTLALDTEAGFVTLSYTQQGLSCQGPVPRGEIRWDTESDLSMGRPAHAEEWLDLRRATRWEARRRAEKVAANMNLRLVEQELRL